jgi:cell division septal protein FtsQ
MILGAIVAGLVLAGGWFALRGSAIVAIDHVTITGDNGPEAPAIRAALESAAHQMTTLDLQSSRLRAAVASFPEVKGLRISAQFPHGLLIHVVEQLPVATINISGHVVAVAGDGTLLEKQSVAGSLPVIALREPPIGMRLTQGWPLGAAKLLAAAPRQLLGRLAEAMSVAGHGLVVQVRNGPSIYFGDATRAHAKWDAALAVLADPGSAGAAYIDVTDPSRPAAGAGTAGTSSSTTTGPTTASSSSTSAASSTASTSPSTASTSPTTAGGATVAAAQGG